MSKLHRDNAGYIGCSFEETQDPYYSYNKLALPLDGDINSVLREEVTFTVTVANVGGSNKYFIDGVQQATVTLLQGNVYTFDQSDNSNNNHPLRFSYTADGTHGGGTEITLGVTKNGTPGQSGAYTRIVVPFGLHDLKYYCSQHSGMGGAANVTSNPNMTTFGLPILKTTDAFGKTLGSGNNADPYAANLVLAVPMNGSNGGTSVTDISNAIRGTGSAKAISVYTGSASGGAVISTAQSNYYGSSFYAVRGTTNNYTASDYIYRTGDSDFNFGTGDFTVEFWFNPTNLESNCTIFDNRHPTTNWPNSHFGFQFFTNAAGDLYFRTGSGYPISASAVLTQGAWSHLAITRKAGTINVFHNGSLLGSAANHNNDFNEGRFHLGSAANNGEGSTGYYSDLRIYKGVAKYTTPFPTGEYGFKAITYTGNGTGLNKIGGSLASAGVTATGTGQVSGIQSSHPIADLFDGSTSTYLATNGANISSSPAILTITFPTGNQPTYNSSVVIEPYGGSSDTVQASINGGALQSVSTSGSWTQHTLATGSGTITEIKVTRQKSNTNGGAAEIRKIIIDGVELLDGDGSTIPFSPDLVWLKNDDSYTGHHCLYDSVRGVYKHIQTSSNAAEYTESTGRGLSSFNSEGFTLDTSTNEHAGEGNINLSGQQYVAYVWNAGNTTTTVAAGSLNSSAYNQSQTWSGNISTTGNSGTFHGSYPATNAFNNNDANYAHGNGDGAQTAVVTLTLNPGVSCSNTVTFLGGMTGSGTATISVNGGTAVSLTSGNAPTTKTNVSFSGTVTSIVITKTSSDASGMLIYGFEIDGARLVDSGVTPTNVPSRASTVSSNPAAGFSISTFTSPSSGTFSIGHKLNTAPKLVIVKTTGTGSDWSVYHASAVTNTSQYLVLNSQAGLASSSTIWGDALPTSSVVGLTSGGAVATSQPCVAYCWSEVPNYSKISSYTGTGASGNVVTTGFRPAFLLIKGDIAGEDWIIMDNARTPLNPVNDAFFANTLAVPNAISVYSVDFNDDGFTVNNTNPRFNTNTKTYYYMAFAESSASDAVYKAVGLSEVKTSDLSSSAHTITNNGATFQTSVEKFYDGAAAFTNGSSVSVPSTSELQFGTGDFTVEGWVYLNSYGGGYSAVVSSNWILRINNGQVVWFSQVNGGTNHASANVFGLNQWSHIAVTRQAGTLKIYLNGFQILGVADPSDYSSSNTTYFGRQSAHNVYGLEGYLQDFRLYKGIAKYTSSFSPPERSIQATARRYPSGVYVVS